VHNITHTQAQILWERIFTDSETQDKASTLFVELGLHPKGFVAQDGLAVCVKVSELLKGPVKLRTRSLKLHLEQARRSVGGDSRGDGMGTDLTPIDPL
jgi:hypothetical protein